MNSRARFCVPIGLASIRFLLLALVIVSAPRIAFAQSFTITEILAANETAFVDSDGDVSDWIEIHNPTTTTTALTGWYLSDDPKVEVSAVEYPGRRLPRRVRVRQKSNERR